MATKGKGSPLGRSAHTSKARAANAAKLSRLRGEEAGTVRKRSSFDAAVNIAKRFKPKKGGPDAS